LTILSGTGKMKTKAIVRLQFSSEKHLTTLLKALAPEIDAPPTRRAKTTLGKEGKFLILKVEAKDTVALRATLNAYLRWIGSTVNVLKTIEQNP
jgi:tRNA threonylcarbamoyladenosine modification (KEOPS) complex  Pcc1 subunit